MEMQMREIYGGYLRHMVPEFLLTSAEREFFAQFSRECLRDAADHNRRIAAEQDAKNQEELDEIRQELQTLRKIGQCLAIQNRFSILLATLGCPTASLEAEFLGHYDHPYHLTESQDEYLTKLQKTLEDALFSEMEPPHLGMKDGNVVIDLAVDCKHSVTCLIPPQYWWVNDQGEALNPSSFGYKREYEAHKAVLPSIVDHPQILQKLDDDFVELLFVTPNEENQFIVASPKDATHVLVKLEYSLYTNFRSWMSQIAEALYGDQYAHPTAQDVIEYFYDEQARAEFCPQLLSSPDPLSNPQDFGKVVWYARWTPALLMPELDLIMESDQAINSYRRLALVEFCQRAFDLYLQCGDWC